MLNHEVELRPSLNNAEIRLPYLHLVLTSESFVVVVARLYASALMGDLAEGHLLEVVALLLGTSLEGHEAGRSALLQNRAVFNRISDGLQFGLGLVHSRHGCDC